MSLSRNEGWNRIAAALLGPLSLTVHTGCAAVTSHPAEAASLGTARPSSALLQVIDVPGPVLVETVVAADWEVPRGGLLNLDHPTAEAAGIEDEDEPIQLYFHALRHPERGLYLVDTGVERAQWESPDEALIGGLVGAVMNLGALKVHVDTRTWLAKQTEPLSGVFLTHLHADHVMGMRDVPPGATVFAGPGETKATSFENLFASPILDAALSGKGPIATWAFAKDPDGRFDGVLDVFGDGTVWALHVPGHTPGSTAYLARTPRGPVLMVGDACHTAWGWENEVEPGDYTADPPRNAESLKRLRRLADEHAVDVRLGHQPTKHPLGTPFGRTGEGNFTSAR